MVSRAGQCLCGGVSFEVLDAKSSLWACHCNMCQRWTGSAFLGVTVAKEAANFTGSENIDVGQTSDWAERAWCNKCGSGLWYRITSPDSVFSAQYQIPVGLFDDAEGIKLDREIFYDCKSSAFQYGDETKKMTEAEVWADVAGPEGETNDQV